jgi:hypothetical protein
VRRENSTGLLKSSEVAGEKDRLTQNQQAQHDPKNRQGTEIECHGNMYTNENIPVTEKGFRAGSSRVSNSISRRPMVKDPEGGAVVDEDSRLEEEGPCVETFG